MGLELGALRRPCTDPDLSLDFEFGGEYSNEAEGDGVFRVSDDALSATDGGLLELVRTLPFRTEKNAGAGTEGGPAGGGVWPGALLDNFSSAFIL
jgi:hypothetical protein